MTRTAGLLLSMLLALSAAAAGADTRDGPVLRLRVWADQAGRDWLSAQGLDIAGYELEQGWVEIITDAEGADRISARGLRSELLEWRPGPRPLGADGAPCNQGVQCYTDPVELEAFLDQVVADHPAITRRVALGTTEQGRTIWGLMISDNAATDEDELSILFNGAHHAREIMTPEVVMDIIDYLTDNYGVDPVVTSWVDAYEIWCVPMVNPDGVAIVHSFDDLWRKNARDNDLSGGISSQDGVDLNRNYEWGWGNQCLGSSGTFSSQTYRGPSEGSEPEPQALAALGNRTRPVFDVDYHSYGEDVFYAMSCDPVYNPKLTTVTGPDQDISRVIAEGYAAQIVQADGGVGYASAPFGSRVDGTGRDQQFHENGTIAFVTEVNTATEGGFHPDYDTYRDVTVQGQRPGWQWLIDRIAGPAIGGHVRDAVTLAPLAVDLALDELLLPDGKRLTSRADTGRFHLIVVPGSYTLRVRAPGYQEAVVPVTVGSAWQPLTVDLQPLGTRPVVADDLEDAATPAVWSVGDPSDTAVFGVWVWGVPEGTHSGDAVLGTLTFGNPGFDRTPGEAKHAFVTGNAPGGSISLDDVDGGATTLHSPSWDLSGLYAVEISYHRWFRNDAADPGDLFTADVSTDGGASWVNLETLTQSTATADASPAWVPVSLRLDDVAAPGPDVRLRFRAADTGLDNTVEAAIDDLTIRGYDLATDGQVAGVRVSGGASTRVDWDAVSGAPDAIYDVVRGDLASLGASGGIVDLGTLVCIEEDSTDATTAGDEDVSIPAPGTAYFYLVRFELGFSTGEWGRSSADEVRQGTGGCSP